MKFYEKFVKARDEKNSLLCLGLDPAIPEQREKNVIKMHENKEVRLALLEACLDWVEQCSDFCCAAKVNMTYVLPFTEKEHTKLATAIRDNGMVSLLDWKLGDIGSSNDSALYWISRCGYDSLTFNPFPGNVKEAGEAAHKRELGLIVLTLMSNPDFVHFMKKATVEGKPGYQWIAEQVRDHADGCIVGATGHVTSEEINKIRQIVGQEKVFFSPGVGAQGGNAEKLIKAGGEPLAIIVVRGIDYADNPGESAKYYRDLINKARGRSL
jgi:orotidine-5'-phosphate decarboxylase